MKMNRKMMIMICPLLLAAAACQSNSTKDQSAMQEHAQSAAKQVADATAVIQRMETDPNMSQLLQSARGVFIVPHYGQAALGIGGMGGEGLLVVKRGNSWSDPAFYNFGGISAGLQAGAEGGPLAFILNNEKAVQQFMKKSNFQLSADAGLTVVNWSKVAQAELSKADVVAWSGTKGLFGGAAVSLNNIRFDQGDSNGFYGQTASIDDIFAGRVKASADKTNTLKRALSVSSPSMSGGSSNR